LAFIYQKGYLMTEILADETVLVNCPPNGGLSFIEHLHADATQKCPNSDGKFIVGINHRLQKAMVFVPNCKQWSCPVCSLRNAKKWIARVINGINILGGDWYMLTLTSHEKMRGTQASLKNLREGFTKFAERMRRKYGTRQYVKVWELHQDKSLHLHFLIDCNLGKKWTKDNARACGMGYQIEIHKIDNAGMVAGYIAKYTLKNAANLPDMPKNLRRIQCSLKFPKLPKLGGLESDWLWVRLETEYGVFNTMQKVYERGYEMIGVDKVSIEGDDEI
jgi:Replication protein